MPLLKKIRESDGPFTKTGKILNYKEIHPYQVGFHFGKEGKEISDRVERKYREEDQYLYGGYDHGKFYRQNKKKVWTGIAALAGFVASIIGFRLP